MISDRKILLSSIRCPDGTVLTSTHRHDFKRHVQADGRSYAVDGGTDYLRRLCDDAEFVELSVCEGDSSPSP